MATGPDAKNPEVGLSCTRQATKLPSAANLGYGSAIVSEPRYEPPNTVSASLAHMGMIQVSLLRSCLSEEARVSIGECGSPDGVVVGNDPLTGAGRCMSSRHLA